MLIARASLASLILLSSAMMMTLSSTAYAQSARELTQHLPHSTGLVIGVNAREARNTTLYQQGLAMLRQAPEAANLMTTLQDQLAIDLERDVDAVALGLQLSAATKAKVRGDEPFVAVLSGRFDRAALDARHPAASRRAVNKLSVIPHDAADAALLNDTTLVLVGGKQSFRDSAWASLSGKGKSLPKNAAIQGLFKQVDTTKAVWGVANLKNIPAIKDKPKVNALTFDLDASAGLGLRSRMTLKDEADASAALAQMEQRRQDAGLMAAMVGAGPLVRNLSIAQDKAQLRMASAMTEPELRTLLQRLASMRANPAPKAAAPASKPPSKPAAP